MVRGLKELGSPNGSQISEEENYFNKLPNEIVEEVLIKTSSTLTDYVNICSTCKSWQQIAQKPSFITRLIARIKGPLEHPIVFSPSNYPISPHVLEDIFERLQFLSQEFFRGHKADEEEVLRLIVSMKDVPNGVLDAVVLKAAKKGYAAIIDLVASLKNENYKKAEFFAESRQYSYKVNCYKVFVEACLTATGQGHSDTAVKCYHYCPDEVRYEERLKLKQVFDQAFEQDNVQITAALIPIFVGSRKGDILKKFAEHNRLEMIKLFLKGSPEDSALSCIADPAIVIALKKGYIDAAKKILNHCIEHIQSVNCWANRTLCEAAQSCQIDIVRLVLKQNFWINLGWISAAYQYAGNKEIKDLIIQYKPELEYHRCTYPNKVFDESFRPFLNSY